MTLRPVDVSGQERAPAPRGRRPGESDPADAPRMPWPDWWQASADRLVASRCRALWVQVLARCLIDSLFADADLPLGTNARSDARFVGAGWWRSRAMREVADLAGFDGRAMQQRLHAKIARSGIQAVAREVQSVPSQQGNRRKPRSAV